MNTYPHRSELLFLYDIKYANPNGDPMDANRPRMDEETGHCLVTDVRLKRTIRDYLYQIEEKEIFIREVELDDGSIQDAKLRAEDFLKADKKSFKTLKDYKNAIRTNVLNDCIDVRLFGVTMPLEKSSKEKSSITLTGPVQFGMGKSLHPVRENFIQGTGAFASKKGAEQKTFREEYNITYGLIGFHGIVNENAGKKSNLRESDVQDLLKGMWLGTKNLITRSKKGHMPRLLIKVDYIGGFFIGDLMELITIESNKEVKMLEDIKEYTLNVSKLNEQLKKHQDRITSISYEIDSRFELNEPIFQAKDLKIQ